MPDSIYTNVRVYGSMDEMATHIRNLEAALEAITEMNLREVTLYARDVARAALSPTTESEK